MRVFETNKSSFPLNLGLLNVGFINKEIKDLGWDQTLPSDKPMFLLNAGAINRELGVNVSLVCKQIAKLKKRHYLN